MHSKVMHSHSKSTIENSIRSQGPISLRKIAILGPQEISKLDKLKSSAKNQRTKNDSKLNEKTVAQWEFSNQKTMIRSVKSTESWDKHASSEKKGFLNRKRKQEKGIIDKIFDSFCMMGEIQKDNPYQLARKHFREHKHKGRK